MRRLVVKRTRRGDTLIEVMLSISIFAMVAMLTINMMNDGINTAQRTLEAEMARNEIDAQAEALRYIHNSYVSERQKSNAESQFRRIWNTLISNSVSPRETDDSAADEQGDGGTSFDINDFKTCAAGYNGTDKHLRKFKAFVLNPRLIIPDTSLGGGDFKYMGTPYSELMNHMVIYDNDTSGHKFAAPALYPRIIYKRLSGSSTDTNDAANLDENNAIYNDVATAEGIWIDAVGNNKLIPRRSDYYDFYIRTCWHGAGQTVPSTITTVVRLYNPEVME